MAATNKTDIPNWLKNKNKYDRQYQRENLKAFAVKLNRQTEARYIAIYEQIPNKREFLKACLDRYAEENNLKID